MKKIIFVIVYFIAFAAEAQVSPINISDDPRIQYQGAACKRKFFPRQYSPTINGTTDFYLAGTIKYYQNVSGSYSALTIPQMISADTTLQASQKNLLTPAFADRFYDYTTAGSCMNAAGTGIVPCITNGVPTVGAQGAFTYWSSFKLSQVAGIAAESTQGALATDQLLQNAIVLKLDALKQF